MSADSKDYDNLIDGYVHPADSPQGRATTLDALKRYFRALRAKDLEALRSLMTDDVITEIPFGESGKTDEGSFRVYRGLDEVLGFWATAFKAEGKSHGVTETDLTVSADGSRVFFEGRGTVRNITIRFSRPTHSAARSPASSRLKRSDLGSCASWPSRRQ